MSILKIYGPLYLKLFGNVASVASILALFLYFTPDKNKYPWWAIILIVAAILTTIVYIVLEVRADRYIHRFKKSDAAGIKDYMHDWLQHGGRVAIWTRDLSWADNAETLALLETKSKSKELILCLPEVTDLTSKLETLGAEICAYGSALLESPASRFTIAYFGRDGSQVAIGHALGDLHVIHEFDGRSDPAFHVAKDLVDLARATLLARR